MIYECGGDKFKIHACIIKDRNFPIYNMQSLLHQLESIFPTRLPDETFRGIINFMEVIILKPSIDEIEKALVRQRKKYK